MNTKEFRSLFPTILTGEILGDSLLDSHFTRTVQTSHKIEETENGWTVEIPLAGVSKKDIKTKISERNKLIVEVSVDSKWHGGLTKRFSLPNSCDIDNITVKHSDGVLTLIVPKMESFKERVLEIK